MGIFNCEGHVLLREVERFGEAVDDFNNAVGTNASEIDERFGEAVRDIGEICNAVGVQAARSDALYGQIQALKSSIEQRISSLRSELAATPKYIEKTVTDEEGNEKVVKEPNPRYAEIENQIHAQESRLSAAKELSWGVYNKQSELHREFSYAQQILGEVEAASKSVSLKLTELKGKTEAAKNAVHATEESILNYTRVKF